MFGRRFFIIAFAFAFIFRVEVCSQTVVPDAANDFNGDGKTDFTVVRNTGGGADGQMTWFTKLNGGSPTTPFNWGTASDVFLSGDFDGDRKDDITVWRPSSATFYILQSLDFTIRLDQFGQAGDDPTVVADYDGDGKDDVAVYRPGSQGRWYYRTDPNTYFVTVNWGTDGDFVAPGDYDGDGKADFVIYRAASGSGTFFKRLSREGFSNEEFSFPGSVALRVVPGDYDGDGKTDISVRGLTLIGNYQWHFKPSGTPGTTRVSHVWGDGLDIPVQGDYTGDGKTDYAVWRPSNGTFYILTVDTRNIFTTPWGQSGDYPVANYNAHKITGQ